MDDGIGEYANLRALLSILDANVRDHLRRVLIHDQADRDAIASRLGVA
jgi:nanoRNase/pAp phosphatase (c-di-AMP/oligoRNAs hydrolase)